MIRMLQLRLVVFMTLPIMGGTAADAQAQERLKYPATRQVEQVDEYHGVQVKDPYRWLEDANSPETAQWVEAENAVTFDYLKKLPQREKLRARLTELWNYSTLR